MSNIQDTTVTWLLLSNKRKIDQNVEEENI